LETLETTLVIVGYEIHIEALAEDLTDQWITIHAKLETMNGQEIGVVETDYEDYARNLPLALIKVYLLERKLRSGKLIPDVNF
jgi:hypothetical protein